MIELLTHIPSLILAGSAGLVLLFLGTLLHMLTKAGRLKKHFAAIRRAWASVEPLPRADRGNGLDGRKFAELQAKCKNLQDTAKSWWHAVDESLERYTSPEEREEREGWFTAKPLREILPEDLIGSHSI